MGQRVRTAAPMGDWRTLTGVCTKAAGYSQYDIIKLEGSVCIVYFEESVSNGDTFYPIYHCDGIVVDKRTGTAYAFAAGDKVYWSGVDGDPVTPVHQSGFYWIGIATEAAGANDSTVEIDFKGDKATVTEPC